MTRMRTPRRIYTPKMTLKDVVVELMKIINQMSWEQANREWSGQDYHLQVSKKLQELAIEMKKWGTVV